MLSAAKRTRRAGPRPFDPARYETELVAILRELDALDEVDAAALDRVLRRHPRDGRGFFSRTQLLAGHRAFGAQAGLRHSEAAFRQRLQLRPVRSLSGVTPVTVLTKPFPCPGQCVFCPNDVRMPKSYLSDEPGAQRAAANRFDPYLQTWNRLAAYRAMGHPTDKVELIVLGGTWSFYPEPYQIGFVTRCLEAMADFAAGRDERSQVVGLLADPEDLPAQLDGRALGPNYNQRVGRWLDAAGGRLADHERASWEELRAAQSANETAGVRCVGLVLETRPDAVSEAEVLRLRRLGATKVQLGVQSLSDAVLAANRRGHDVATTRRAVGLLRAAGFKLHVHWMANLLGATPERDLEDFGALFRDPALRPDELKLYPCSLVESAELMGHYERGEWRPYGHDELLAVVTGALRQVPEWCRVTRVIRDISSDDIVVGNKLTNFREIAERRLREDGSACRDIRSREVRSGDVEVERLTLRARPYATGVGRELFLEWETPEGRIAGFLRLSLPAAPSFVAELGRAAVVRELHVYGAARPLGDRARDGAQHRGLGESLLAEAARRARAAGFSRLAVISAVGTRDYYRRRGFRDGDLYQHLNLRDANLL
ncbi:MAG: tRNA uridine(34) 5-carboxymethylaminomethyl modification radical SAM/GNAT enzyme Elp3 [Proteobacteria bacterium]|nr:tRNA uridine(34) 5-carboxymethylaminomethyl modification radical SAM/GNAT enzyme Elp3 [Pseudomonadota bacterium]